MAYRCLKCKRPCEGRVVTLQVVDIEGSIAASECCDWHVIDENGKTVKAIDLPEAQAWLDRGAMAQEK